MSRQSQFVKSMRDILRIILLVILVMATAFAQHPTGQENTQASAFFEEGMELFSRGTHEALEAALTKLEEARKLYKASGDKVSEAMVSLPLGRINESLGRKQAALDDFGRALLLYKEIGRKGGQAMALHNIGAVHQSFGELDKALAYYSQALKLQEELGNEFDQAGLHNSIGTIYDEMGDNEKALLHYESAMGLTGKTAQDMPITIDTLTNLAGIYTKLGEVDKALEYYKFVFEFYASTDNKVGVAKIITEVARINEGIGDTRTALEQYGKALGLLRYIGDRSGEATVLNDIGRIYNSAGEKQKALSYFEQALLLYSAVNDKFSEPFALGSLMRSWQALDNSRLSVFWGKQAVNRFQELRQAFQSLDKQAQKSYLKEIEQYYRQLAELLIEQKRYAEANQVLNSFKDQQYFDFNREMQKKASPLLLTPREASFAERYEQAATNVYAAGQRLDELKRKVGTRQPNAEESAQMQQLEIGFKSASDEFRSLIKQAETEFGQPPSEKDKIGEIADTREMQTALRELDRQTGQRAVAIYTIVGLNNYHALIVTSDKITAVSHPTKGAQINAKALQLWALLQSDKYDPSKLAQELYSIIFKPVEAELPQDTHTILWSLDGNLRYLPMAALNDGRQYLIERYNHVVFTRADRERLMRAVSPRWSGVGLGSSQEHTVELLGDRISFNALPGVSEEMRAIFRQSGSTSGVIDGDVLPDAKFTKTAMLAALKQKRPLVHIASHFSFRPGDEARSFLLLGDGSVMTLSEMKEQTDLFAGVQLLTLSACNTAAQQAGADGREIDGFAELAQRLGASSVMATLWSAADNSTPWLMREFYQTRQNADGLTKAEALRRGQLALLKGTAQTKPLPEAQKGPPQPLTILITANDGKRDGGGVRSQVVYVAEKDAPPFKRDNNKPFAHPYYWAPFILIGNWR